MDTTIERMKRASTIFAMLVVSGLTLGACDAVQPPLPSEGVASRSSALSNITISGTVSDTSGLTLGDITVTLTGSAQATTTTDFSGNYSFSVTPGSYTVTPSGLCGAFAPSHAQHPPIQRLQRSGGAAHHQSFTSVNRAS